MTIKLPLIVSTIDVQNLKPGDQILIIEKIFRGTTVRKVTVKSITRHSVIFETGEKRAIIDGRIDGSDCLSDLDRYDALVREQGEQYNAREAIRTKEASDPVNFIISRIKAHVEWNDLKPLGLDTLREIARLLNLPE